MSKRRQKNNCYNKIENFLFIDIPHTVTASASSTMATKSIVSKVQVINIAEWNIEGNWVSTSNSLATSVVDKTQASMSGGCPVQTHPPHQSDLINNHSDMSFTDSDLLYADSPQFNSSSTNWQDNPMHTWIKKIDFFPIRAYTPWRKSWESGSALLY